MATETTYPTRRTAHVTTIDRYGTTRTYDFRRNQTGTLEPYGDGRKYTPVVLQALWEDGQVVDWDPDDLTAEERARLDGFCDDCGTALRQQQVGPDAWETHCDGCGELVDTTN